MIGYISVLIDFVVTEQAFGRKLLWSPYWTSLTAGICLHCKGREFAIDDGTLENPLSLADKALILGDLGKSLSDVLCQRANNLKERLPSRIRVQVIPRNRQTCLPIDWFFQPSVQGLPGSGVLLFGNPRVAQGQIFKDILLQPAVRPLRFQLKPYVCNRIVQLF